MHLLLTAYGGGSGGGGIVHFVAETLYTADNNEVTIEVNAGGVAGERKGQKGRDGKVYGNYLPLSFPSSQPSEEVRILFYFKCLYLSSFVFVYKQPTDYRPAFV